MRRWRFPRTLRARLTVTHLIAMLVVTAVYATIVSVTANGADCYGVEIFSP